MKTRKLRAQYFHRDTQLIPSLPVDEPILGINANVFIIESKLGFSGYLLLIFDSFVLEATVSFFFLFF